MRERDPHHSGAEPTVEKPGPAHPAPNLAESALRRRKIARRLASGGNPGKGAPSVQRQSNPSAQNTGDLGGPNQAAKDKQDKDKLEAAAKTAFELVKKTDVWQKFKDWAGDKAETLLNGAFSDALSSTFSGAVVVELAGAILAMMADATKQKELPALAKIVLNLIDIDDLKALGLKGVGMKLSFEGPAGFKGPGETKAMLTISLKLESEAPAQPGKDPIAEEKKKLKADLQKWHKGTSYVPGSAEEKEHLEDEKALKNAYKNYYSKLDDPLATGSKKEPDTGTTKTPVGPSKIDPVKPTSGAMRVIGLIDLVTDFAASSAALTADAQKQVAKMAGKISVLGLLPALPGEPLQTLDTVEVTGYFDPVGEKTGSSLGQKRADAVQAGLVQGGLSAKALTSKNGGASEASAADSPRRVVVMAWVKKQPAPPPATVKPPAY